ncbi:DUF3298 and DUF4163 domain-containing protein [Hyphomonas sp.]|uniref:DUF3298 and DUF4163 domain-containing protein n=1 Tax=Hyphomonas sp. TaxID=87 RepID=UPI00391DF44F
MIRSLMTLSMAALMLAACSPGEAGGPADGAEQAAAPAALPASLGSPAAEIRNDHFNGLAVADPRIAAFDPALAERLMAQAREALEEMDAAATRDQAEWAEAEAEEPQGWTFRPYEMEIRYRVTAEGFGLLSLQMDTYVNSGGAHPNYALGGAVYAAGASQPVPISAIIAEPERFGAGLKAKLVNAKIERGYSEESRAYVTDQVEEILGSDMSAGTDWAETFVLQASTEEGLFGGLTVLFSPYDVGPYAEGSYEITFTADDLEGLLTPDWAARFGGEPVIPAEGP